MLTASDAVIRWSCEPSGACSAVFDGSILTAFGIAVFAVMFLVGLLTIRAL